MPYLRHRSFAFAPASASFSTPMICPSVNRFDFIVRSHLGGLYSITVLFAGSTSEELDGPPDPGVEQAWLEEAQRRSRELDSGAVTAIPAEEVLAKARTELKPR